MKTYATPDATARDIGHLLYRLLFIDLKLFISLNLRPMDSSRYADSDLSGTGYASSDLSGTRYSMGAGESSFRFAYQ